MTEAGTPLTIKRYAGKRLYNPAAGAYVTLDDLGRWIGDDADFTVTDAETGSASGPTPGAGDRNRSTLMDLPSNPIMRPARGSPDPTAAGTADSALHLSSSCDPTRVV